MKKFAAFLLLEAMGVGFLFRHFRREWLDA